MLSNLVIWTLVGFIIYLNYRWEKKEVKAFQIGYQRGLEDGRRTTRTVR